MNVLLLGEHGEQLDEGMKNTSVKLHDEIGALEGHSTTLLDLRSIATAEFWKLVHEADPDVVHLIPGPTPQGLALLRLIGAWKGADTVATATQPLHVGAMTAASPLLAPDRLLVQSTALGERFEAEGFDTEFVPSGVDLEAFAPQADATELRRELDLPEDERLFLHVGHCKEGRNVRALTRLNEFGEVVVVGSPSTGPEETVVEDLRAAGCTVQTDYVEEIDRYYNAADVYVFPVVDGANSIQVPLSVFEAMACDRPVVATRFGGLTDCFEPGDGLRFVDDVGEVTEEDLAFETVETREKVADYSWSSIGQRVAEIYGEL